MKVTQVRVILTTVPRAPILAPALAIPVLLLLHRHISVIPSQPARVARERCDFVSRPPEPYRVLPARQP